VLDIFLPIFLFPALFDDSFMLINFLSLFSIIYFELEYSRVIHV